jgi:hypothetical protein
MHPVYGYRALLCRDQANFGDNPCGNQFPHG